MLNTFDTFTEPSEDKKDRPLVDEDEVVNLKPDTYWLTRIVYLRGIAFIYCKLVYKLHWIFDNKIVVNASIFFNFYLMTFSITIFTSLFGINIWNITKYFKCNL